MHLKPHRASSEPSSPQLTPTEFSICICQSKLLSEVVWGFFCVAWIVFGLLVDSLGQRSSVGTFTQQLTQARQP